MQGARSTSPNYNFNADANRDGRIGKIDVAFTLQNQGISTNITPVVQANYDTSHDVPGTTRVSSIPTAHFTGTATPGSTITFAEANKLVPTTTTTADATGQLQHHRSPGQRLQHVRGHLDRLLRPAYHRNPDAGVLYRTVADHSESVDSAPDSQKRPRYALSTSMPGPLCRGDFRPR